ncbi:hypothetical protein ED733_002203 [Metarhizium rileyi]|uniref:DNA recombination and repair protein Rad51-like C-terminal domain-containing protein n=1 Tax=Metarhizium rileyi (strain RCEF 4871) TaxID=1649241 RepID=A0A5C6GBD6_METRR|nr:hypothetical protein ED733_002203 [Metarhizium rileyi]
MDDSQANPFPMAPMPASILAEREAERRNHLVQLGYLKTACPEIDDYVLLGGLERGHVVGLSAEEEAFGMAILSRALLEHASLRALIVTPKPAGVILRSLRDGIRAELVHEGTPAGVVEQRVAATLDSVMLSCVFDMDGLWEVLADLDAERKPPSPPVEDAAAEIQDSQDETSSSSPSPPAESPSTPSLILITHFSSLLTSLFTQRAGPSAHASLSLLSSRLRHLARSLPSHPLVLVLNATSSSDPRGAESGNRPSAAARPLDPSLRSIFSPPPLPIPGYVSTSARRNKPLFGLVFTQLLDLHLLASRVPRTRADAEAALGTSAPRTAFVTVVEVLLDEMGLWTGAMGRRPSREQRWAAVQLSAGRVVDAFGKRDVTDAAGIRTSTSGGFGGRRP